MNTLPLIWMAVLFATAVPGFTPKARMQPNRFAFLPAEDKTVRNPDSRVEKALKKLGLKYEVDEDGDFKLVFAVEDNRSTTETLGKMEIREVWSPIANTNSGQRVSECRRVELGVAAAPPLGGHAHLLLTLRRPLT